MHLPFYTSFYIPGTRYKERTPDAYVLYARINQLNFRLDNRKRSSSGTAVDSTILIGLRVGGSGFNARATKLATYKVQATSYKL